MTQVAWPGSTFGAYTGDRYVAAMADGLTIAQMIDQIGSKLPRGFRKNGVVCINGEPIRRDLWHRVRPKGGTADNPVSVTLHFAPGRGGGRGGGAGGGDAGGGGGREGRGKNILIIIATIALIALTAWIGGGGIGAALGLGILGPGSFGAQILAAGIGIIGSLALAALSPPPANPLDQGGSELGFSFGASAAANLIGRGRPLPRVLGTHRIFPPMISEPWVEIVDSFNEYAFAIFALAGPHKLEDIRVNDSIVTADLEASLAANPEVDFFVATREGWANDTELGEYGGASEQFLQQYEIYQHKTTSESVTLTGHTWAEDDSKAHTAGFREVKDAVTAYPIWHRFTTAYGPDRFTIDLDFPQGLTIDAAGAFGTAGAIMPVRVRIRPKPVVGTETGSPTPEWHNLPEIWFYGDATKAQRQRIQIDFVASALQSHLMLGAHDNGAIHAMYLWGFTPSVSSPFFPGWVVDPYYDDGSGADYAGPGTYITGTTLAATRVRGWQITAAGVEFGINVNWSDIPSGGLSETVWEVEIQRGAVFQASQSDLNYQVTEGSLKNWNFFEYQYSSIAGSPDVPVQTRAQENQIDSISVIRTRSTWADHPVQNPPYVTGSAIQSGTPPPHAFIAIGARNRAIQSVSVRASGYVPDYVEAAASPTEQGEWANWTTTSNPAAHFRHLLTDKTLNRRALDPSVIDDESLIAWRAECAAQGYTADLIADGSSIADTLNMLAGAGYARPFKSEKWGIAYDRNRSTEDPIQIFTPRNMRAFSWSKAFADLPDHFIATYLDSTKEYEPQELIVYADGFDADTAVLPETVRYNGVVTEAAVTARAKYDLRTSRFRSTFYQGEVFVENLVCRRGDLVGIQHDILDKQSGFARIKSITESGSPSEVTGLVLDGDVLLNIDDDGNPDAGIVMAIAIRLRDGTVLTKRIDYVGGWTDTITFTTPFEPVGDILAVDNLVAVGPLYSEYKRAIILDIEALSEGRARMVFVDEAIDLFVRTAKASATIAITATAALQPLTRSVAGSAAIAITATGVMEVGIFVAGSGTIAITATAAADVLTPMSGSASISITATAVATKIGGAFDNSFDNSFDISTA